MNEKSLKDFSCKLKLNISLQKFSGNKLYIALYIANRIQCHDLIILEDSAIAHIEMNVNKELKLRSKM